MATVETERRISHYRIEGELGAGGMGVIYRAVDERLGRRVAIKCLRGSLSASASARQRFFDEARAAASLDHPNICTIYDVDECDGEIFIAMALYDGETLDVVLKRGAIPLQRSLDLAIQVGRGLAAAHEELLVHRDIKPANIMITTHESVKILDFGLALLRGSGTIDDDARVDGTPFYMSPEQLRGEPADHRSDIWSLGVVLFEMLTGSQPFRGESLPAIADAVLRGATPSTTASGIDVPPAIDQILSRALARDLRSRYARIDLFVDDLRNLRAEVDSAALTVRRQASSRRASIAVLPFTDMSPERNQEYLCDGIAEEVLGALSSVAELRVVSRTSAFQFKGQSTDIRDIGAKLNVDTVVEGSVRRSGNRVRISAQLVNVEDGYRLWYERFDREMKDIFAIQDEIAQCVANALQVSLVERSRHPGAVVSSNDAEAYALYLQGRQFFHQHRRKAFEIAIQNFRRVIDMNPAYARAWAGLADCNSFLRLFLGGGPDTVVASEEASAKALELAPDLAEAHTSRGFSLFLTERYDEAEAELRRAVELDPQLYDAHYLFGRISFARGRYADAAAHFRRGCTISPEAYDSWYLLGMCYRKLNEPVKGRNADRECIEAVKARVRQHPDDTRAWTMGAAVLAEAGEPERAAEWVQRAVAIDSDEPIIAYNAACVYTALGRHEDAIDCLESVVARGGISQSWMMNDPDLDPLRDDDRFRALFKTGGVR